MVIQIVKISTSFIQVVILYEIVHFPYLWKLEFQFSSWSRLEFRLGLMFQTILGMYPLCQLCLCFYTLWPLIELIDLELASLNICQGLSLKILDIGMYKKSAIIYLLKYQHRCSSGAFHGKFLLLCYNTVSRFSRNIGESVLVLSISSHWMHLFAWKIKSPCMFLFLEIGKQGQLMQHFHWDATWVLHVII